MPYSTRLQIIFRWVKRKLLYSKCGDAWRLHKVSMDFAQFSSSEVVWLEIFKLDMKWEFLCSSVAGTITGHLLLKQIKGCLRNSSRDENFKTAWWLWLWDRSENKSVVLENDQGKKRGKKRDTPPCRSFVLNRFQSLASQEGMLQSQGDFVHLLVRWDFLCLLQNNWRCGKGAPIIPNRG